MRDYDSGAVTQLTFDSGDKYEVWMWCAPEFGNDLVFSTLVDQVELRVYRKLPVGPGGSPERTPLPTPVAPPGNQIFSPEPFVYAGSLTFLHVAKGRAEPVPLAGLDCQHRRCGAMFKRITPLLPC